MTTETAPVQRRMTPESSTVEWEQAARQPVVPGATWWEVERQQEYHALAVLRFDYQPPTSYGDDWSDGRYVAFAATPGEGFRRHDLAHAELHPVADPLAKACELVADLEVDDVNCWAEGCESETPVAWRLTYASIDGRLQTFLVWTCAEHKTPAANWLPWREEP